MESVPLQEERWRRFSMLPEMQVWAWGLCHACSTTTHGSPRPLEPG